MAESLRSGPEQKESAEHSSGTLAEWLARIASQGSADSLPEVKGKKEKSAFAQAIGELAVSAAFGSYKGVRDSTAFETAIKSYANLRARGVEERVALLRARQDINEQDIGALKDIQRVVEDKLQKIGVAKSEVPMPQAAAPEEQKEEPRHADGERAAVEAENPAAAPEAAAAIEPAPAAESKETQPAPRPNDIPEGWHEEFEGDGDQTKRYLVSDDGKMRVAKKPRETPSDAPAKPLRHEGPEMDDADQQERQRKISAQSSKRKQEKRERKRKDKESTGAPGGAERSASIEYAALTSAEEIKARFGESKQAGRIPYWPLESEAVIYDKLNAGDETARAYRIGDGGVHRFPVGWRRYDAAKREFEVIPDAELAELREALRSNLISVWGENGPKREPRVAGTKAEARPAGTSEDRVPEVRAPGTDAPERGRERRERSPGRERSERTAREEIPEGIPRPAKRPTGKIDGLEYWRERRGSVLIENEQNENLVYRVQRGGLHWAQQPGENGRDLDREALYWNGDLFKVLTRREWKKMQEENEEPSETPRAESAAEARPNAPERPREVAAPAPAPAAAAVPSATLSLEQAERSIQRISSDLTAAMAEPKIGAEAENSAAVTELEQIGTALRRLAATDHGAFEKAQRALTALSTYERTEYKKLETEIDQAAREGGISHEKFADILHEPDSNVRVDRAKAEIRSSLGFFGRALDFCSFGIYSSAKASILVSSTRPLAGRMKKAEAEFGRRRGVLRSILGIS